MKVFITMVSWNTSDDRGTDILGVYRELKDAQAQAQQEVEQWKDDLSYNDDVVFETDNENWWSFDDRKSVYVEVSIIEKDCF